MAPLRTSARGQECTDIAENAMQQVATRQAVCDSLGYDVNRAAVCGVAGH